MKILKFLKRKSITIWVGVNKNGKILINTVIKIF